MHRVLGILMEKFLFSKIETWLVIALMLVGAVFSIGFGYLVLDSGRDPANHPLASSVARTIAEVPDTLRRLVGKDTVLLTQPDPIMDSKPTGWSFPAGRSSGPSGYLLLSRYDGTARRHAMELVSLPDMKMQHRWMLDTDTLLSNVRHISRFSDSQNWNRAHFRQIHPWMAANGDLVVKDHYSPLERVDACGKPRWLIDSHIFHHSTEPDADGNLWIPSLAEKHSIARVKDSFREDTIAKVSPEGKILYTHSVPQILMRNGYTNRLFATEMYSDDPTHLNDIEPVLSDGPHWKKGDVFLSLRNISTIMLYRPSTGQIVWMKRGPWMSQHDVDILDDHRISIYDNQGQDRGKMYFVDGYSSIKVYDFVNDTVTTRHDDVMKAQAIRTTTAGLYTGLPDGHALIEDVTNARMLLLRPDGRIGAEYVNRAADGSIYHLGWSRFISKADGDRALGVLAKAKCAA